MQKLELVEWHGKLEATQWFIDDLTRQLHTITSIPAALANSENIPSGIALRKLALPLYAMSMDMQEDVREGLETAINMVSPTEVTLEWPHYFDIDTAEGQGVKIDDESRDAQESASEEPETDSNRN